MTSRSLSTALHYAAVLALLSTASCGFDTEVAAGNGSAMGDASTAAPDARTPGAADASTPSTPLTLVLRQGRNSYTGTHDTFLQENLPISTHGNGFEIEALAGYPDAVSAASAPLLRFDGLVGSGAGQIPQGSTVTAATLTLTVTDAAPASPGSLFEVLVGWDESTVTWNSFGAAAGIQAGVDYGDLVVSAPYTLGTHDLDVSTSVSKWVSATSENLGWLLVPVLFSDQASYASSESVFENTRPTLTVEFLPPL